MDREIKRLLRSYSASRDPETAVRLAEYLLRGTDSIDPEYIDKPYSIAEIRKLSDNGKQRISGIIQYPIFDSITEWDDFLEDLSQRLTGTTVLQDIEFEIIDCDNNNIYMEIKGDPELILILEDY